MHQEEERSRLARELHDDVTQRLASLSIDAGREERKLSNSATGNTMRILLRPSTTRMARSRTTNAEDERGAQQKNVPRERGEQARQIGARFRTPRRGEGGVSLGYRHLHKESAHPD
jgi:Histidine kinase